MAAVYTGATQYVTALTLALLEDSGWYRPNYDVATNSPFGLGAGCQFVEEECIQNGTVPKWAEGTYCNDASSIGCMPDRHGVAYCGMTQWDGDLPSGYQYFQSASTGGNLPQTDFCPAYTTTFRFELGDDIPVLDCTDADLSGTWIQMEGEVFGEDSRCIRHSSGARPWCLKVICGEDGEDRGKVVLVDGGGGRVSCSYTGEIVQLPGSDGVICPSFEQVCPESICPANCAGRGICDYSLSPAQCECFDKSDSSPSCFRSPLSSATTSSAAPLATSASSPGPSTSPHTAPSSASSTKNPTASPFTGPSTSHPAAPPSASSTYKPTRTEAPSSVSPALDAIPVNITETSSPTINLPAPSTKTPVDSPSTQPSKTTTAEFPTGPREAPTQELSVPSSCRALQPRLAAFIFIGIGGALNFFSFNLGYS